MNEATDEIMKMTKTLLGFNDNKKDSVLLIIAADVSAAILAYCRLEVLPKSIYPLAAQMTAKSYRQNGYGTEEAPEDIKSITEGDRTVSLERRNGSILSDYRARLKPYMNMKGRVPSDIG